jgi:hypothetical protein
MVLAGSGTNWQATATPLPANNNNEGGSPGPVACSAVSSCTTTGTYATRLGELVGMLVTGSGTSWQATQAPAPANNPGLPATVGPLACTPAGPCVAVGGYTDTANNLQAMLDWGSGTTWTSTESPLPGGVPVQTKPTLTAVTCAKATYCLAVGEYLLPSGNNEGLLVSGSGTTWKAIKAPLPGDAGILQHVTLSGVACHNTTTSCVAVGSYDGAGGPSGLLLTRTG